VRAESREKRAEKKKRETYGRNKKRDVPVLQATNTPLNQPQHHRLPASVHSGDSMPFGRNIESVKAIDLEWLRILARIAQQKCPTAINSPWSSPLLASGFFFAGTLRNVRRTRRERNLISSGGSPA
jgi:hypothetical protein